MVVLKVDWMVALTVGLMADRKVVNLAQMSVEHLVVNLAVSMVAKMAESMAG